MDDSKSGNGSKITDIKLREALDKIAELENRLADERNKREFYQTVADFTFGWELWMDNSGNIKYCSPSCYDLTGFTSNQIIASGNIAEFLVYEPDREQFLSFLNQHINQISFSNSLEFRLLTRHKQLCWFSMSVRGVYNKLGNYLGIRASLMEITKLKKAMGFISDLSVSKDFEQKAKLRYKSELDIKERELVSFLLQLSAKNQLLAQIEKSSLRLAKNSTGNIRKELLRMAESAGNELKRGDTVNDLQIQIEKIHPGFTETLKLKHPQLTAKDLKLCSFIRLGLSSKEISGLQNITPGSVEIARVRLRKKLKLSKTRDLKQFLENR